jgi:hypothetical protein
VDEQVVGVAVDRNVLEPLLAGSGSEVEELELEFAAAAAEFLQYRHLRGVRHDHGPQRGSMRNLALGEEVLVYLGRVVGAAAGNFFETLGGERRQSREMQLALVEEALSHAAAGEVDQQDRAAVTQQFAAAFDKHQGNRINPGEIGSALHAAYPARA